MTPIFKVEERLHELEKRVEQLASQLKPAPAERHWIEEMAGSMADFPEFEEVVRLGQEFRKSMTWEREESLRKRTAKEGSNGSARKSPGKKPRRATGVRKGR